MGKHFESLIFLFGTWCKIAQSIDWHKFDKGKNNVHSGLEKHKLKWYLEGKFQLVF